MGKIRFVLLFSIQRQFGKEALASQQILVINIFNQGMTVIKGSAPHDLSHIM